MLHCKCNDSGGRIADCTMHLAKESQREKDDENERERERQIETSLGSSSVAGSKGKT